MIATMPGFSLDPPRRAKAVRLIHLGWRPDAIAAEIHCTTQTIYNMRNNMWIHNSPTAPRLRTIGRPLSITIAVLKGLIDFILRLPCVTLPEMAWFLWEEYGIKASESTISRALKKAKWSKKTARRIAAARSLDLRRDYLIEMAGLNAEQLVFLDESLFNESTGWRLTAWAPIGEVGRYFNSRQRGHSWSFLAAYSVLGYLPCYEVREGYHNIDSFREWIIDSLLPHCNAYPGPNSVIVMDNASAHCHPSIADTIKAHGCLIRYLPPYSPDFSPIELSFGVLKAFVRRRYRELWPHFDGNFGQFIMMCVRSSQCDQYATAHFKYSGNGGYVFEGDREAYDRELRVLERYGIDR
jgi:transposase